jgi:membrane protein DedA with SNARE-associated domain
MSAEALLQALAPYALSPFLMWLAIFFIAFVLEEGAVAFAVLLTLSDSLTVPMASSAVYCGVVTTDIGLYGLGYTASRYNWAARWVDKAKMQRVGNWMGPRLFPAVVLSRLMPWMLPPTFIACGFLRLPFKRFFLCVSSTGAVWTAVVFATLLGFGNVLFEMRWSWSWGAAAAGLFALCVWRIRVAHQRAAAASPINRVVAASSTLSHEAITADAARAAQPNVCWFVKLPSWIFYTPVVCMWLCLALRYRSLTLPTAANPSFECGGFVGESKNQAMEQVASQSARWFAPHVSMVRSGSPDSVAGDAAAALKLMFDAELQWPMVAKPDRGHHGYGVRSISGVIELTSYLAAFPAGETLVLQKLVPLEHEAGVFYVRMPGARQGHIFSMNFSEPAEVMGDGLTSLRELISLTPAVARCAELHHAEQHARLDWVPAVNQRVSLAFARSLRLGATLTDARKFVTPTLTARFDDIAHGINEFYFGRFDVRFGSLEEFQRGENFQIVEVNGVGAEANHIWDPNSRLRDVYCTLFAQFQFAFKIGHINRSRGFKPIGVRRLWSFFITQHRVLKFFQAPRAVTKPSN